MTPEDIALIDRSFARVYPHKGPLARCFYVELFRTAPELKPLFPADMAPQHRKFAAMLVMLVRQLSDPCLIRNSLGDLAKRHLKYGAKPAHFDLVQQALIAALKAETPGGFSAREEQAWTAAFQYISGVMIDHAYPN